ncbi:DUF4231 domain-containing protein [Streptomyces sp. NPDC014889]|uniref:DUF4231 domain-containing protein n=1 Tax=Streptomyces sp. NPDC014889 TaxID=3364928 RepID=UPI0037007BCB
MPRSLDDDAATRVSAAGRLLLFDTRSEVRVAEAQLARRRMINRVAVVTMAIAAAAILTGASGTTLSWDSSKFIRGNIVCGTAVALCAAVLLIAYDRDLPSRHDLQADLESKKESLRRLSAHEYPPLAERRLLYREDIVEVVERYQAESRRYRRVHNSLQTLITVGSALTTAIAALDTGKELTWQSVTLTAVSFAVTLASAFTGYYKYRERSYFLQQTADAIEEESNAVSLGVGPYREFGASQEQEALKLFTERVEDLRNEQRRRQQQLDQPTEQGNPTSQPAG